MQVRKPFRSYEGAGLTMRFRVRKTVRVWPLYFVFSQSGFTSWGVKVWRYTFNVTRRTHTFDTPGPGYVRWGGRR